MPVLESVFNKVAGLSSLKACNFIKKRLKHRCLPVKSLRRPILKNICECLKSCQTFINGYFCKNSKRL